MRYRTHAQCYSLSRHTAAVIGVQAQTLLLIRAEVCDVPRPLRIPRDCHPLWPCRFHAAWVRSGRGMTSRLTTPRPQPMDRIVSDSVSGSSRIARRCCGNHRCFLVLPLWTCLSSGRTHAHMRLQRELSAGNCTCWFVGIMPPQQGGRHG